jgi:hypothetical protein
MFSLPTYLYFQDNEDNAIVIPLQQVFKLFIFCFSLQCGFITFPSFLSIDCYFITCFAGSGPHLVQKVQKSNLSLGSA